MINKKPYATLEVNGVVIELSATELLFLSEGLCVTREYEQSSRAVAGELSKHIVDKLETLGALNNKIIDAVRLAPPKSTLFSDVGIEEGSND